MTSVESPRGSNAKARNWPSLLIAWLALSWSSIASASDEAVRSAALLDSSVGHLVENSRLAFMEAWEETGLEAGGAMEAAEHPIDLVALREAAATRLFDAIGPPSRSQLMAFAASGSGVKLTWLNEELASQGGLRDLRRNGSRVLERLPEDRIALLRRIDRAMQESATAAAAADLLTGIVLRGAAQIEGLLGEPVDWADPPEKVVERLREREAARAFVRLAYLLNRMDAGELEGLLAWVESSSGAVFYAARSEILLAVAAEVSGELERAQVAGITRDLEEYVRDEEEEPDSEEEDDGDG